MLMLAVNAMDMVARCRHWQSSSPRSSGEPGNPKSAILLVDWNSRQSICNGWHMHLCSGFGGPDRGGSVEKPLQVPFLTKNGTIYGRGWTWSTPQVLYP
eukprot:jgi/Botrbrau1/18689/Bobra.0386s0017.1